MLGSALALALTLVAAIGCGSGGSGAKAGSGGATAGTGGTGTAGLGTGGSGTGGGGGGAGGGAAGAAAATGGAGAGTAGAGGAASDPLADCTWALGTGAEIAGPAPTRDNSADLRGPALGDVPFAASTLRRAVPVKVGTTIAGLQIGQAYLTRSSSTSEAVDLTIPVTNAGTDYPCFIKATTFHYLSTTGAILNVPTDSNYLSGSVGDLGGGIYSHTCLGPGETGYFINGQDTPGMPYFSGTTTIEVDLSFAPGMAPGGHLTPKQYDLGTCAGIRTVRVAAVNDGTSTITVAPHGLGFGPAVLLDADGLPAGWIYLEDHQTAQLAPGETTYFFTDLADVPAVTRVQFFLDFDPSATAALASAQAR